MAWYNTMVLRKFHIFDVNLNSVFYVPVALREKGYSFFYSYKNLVATDSRYNSTLTLNNHGGHGYSLSAVSNVSNSSVVSVLVYEVDYVG